MAKKKKSSAKRVVLSILSIVLGFVFVVMLGATVWVELTLNKIQRPGNAGETLSAEQIQNVLQETDAPQENYTGEVLNPEDVVLATAPADIIENEEHIVNILLIGQDRREHQGRQRSDSMILCTFDTEEKTLVMTSFLRDLYVEIPDWDGEDYSDNRLNVCYAIGGMGMLNACLEQNFGVVVDHNIEVDFSGFTEIIDIMGGVDIELTSKEADYMGGGVKTGMNHLNGEQALAYSRIRYIDSDFGRTNRQRTILNALLEQIRGISLADLSDLVNQVLPMITTDMSNTEIAQCVMDIFPVLMDLKVQTQHIPADGTYKQVMIREMSVLVPDMEANRQILKDTLG